MLGVVRAGEARRPTRGAPEWRDAIARVLREMEDLDRSRIDAVQREVLAARAEMRRLLSQKGQTDFGLAQRRAVLAELDRAIDDLDRRLTATVTDGARDAAHLGRASLTRPLATVRGAKAGYDALVPVLDLRAMALASETAGDMVRDVTDEVRRRVRTAVGNVIRGGGTPFDAMTAIVGDDDKQGLPTGGAFKSPLYRAEAIVRTELLGAFNRSHNSAVTGLSKRVPGLMTKTWLWSSSMNPRPAHRALNGTTIPAHEKFDVNGTMADGPHDPALPVDEVVNCHCTTAASIAV
ncbi:MAG: hypothetical protein A2Y36_12835 [Treponema sp. GWA1_62_8]|nr:MAG: hypothetical protein A2Y36_12835 [Treponema sp. GWA1_62_8]